MAKMYIESDNGGRAVALNSGDEWYICDCAPSGCFGDVDILGGTEQDAADRMRKAIESGTLCNVYEYASDVCDESVWKFVPEWCGLTASDVEYDENAGRSCDFMTLTEI